MDEPSRQTETPEVKQKICTHPVPDSYASYAGLPSCTKRNSTYHSYDGYTNRPVRHEQYASNFASTISVKPSGNGTRQGCRPSSHRQPTLYLPICPDNDQPLFGRRQYDCAKLRSWQMDTLLRSSTFANRDNVSSTDKDRQNIVLPPTRITSCTKGALDQQNSQTKLNLRTPESGIVKPSTGKTHFAKHYTRDTLGLSMDRCRSLTRLGYQGKSQIMGSLLGITPMAEVSAKCYDCNSNQRTRKRYHQPPEMLEQYTLFPKEDTRPFGRRHPLSLPVTAKSGELDGVRLSDGLCQESGQMNNMDFGKRTGYGTIGKRQYQVPWAEQCFSVN